MEGMEAWINDLQSMNRRVNPAIKKWVDKTSNKVLRGCVLKTPVGKVNGGTLRRSWKNNKTGDYERIVSNNVKYADFVENGHRIIRSGKVVGYVEGRYMLKRTVEQVENEISGDLSIIIDEITRG